MAESKQRTGPDLPQALARAAFSLIPRPIVGAALRHAAGRITARHPELLERLAPLAGLVIVIDVDEFPEALALTVADAPRRIQVSPVPRHRVEAPAALIGGSFAALIALAEGRADGDALFFQRSIRFEGDTAAVLLLRNALDASEIDFFGEVLPPLGPLALVARSIVMAGARFVQAKAETGAAAGRRPAMP